MSMLKELFIEGLREHYKGLVGAAAVDICFLVCLTWAYVEIKGIDYMQWLTIFRQEAYLSFVIVMVELLIIFWGLKEKRKLSYIA